MTRQQLARRELAVLKSTIEFHEGEIASRTADKRTALHADGPRYDPGAVHRLNCELEELQRRVNDLTDRRAALESCLPTRDQIDAMAHEAADLVKIADDEATAFGVLTRGALNSTLQAEVAWRQVARARGMCRATLGRLTEITAAADLPVRVPPVPELTPSEIKSVVLITELIRECAGGDPDTTTDNELRAVRQAVPA